MIPYSMESVQTIKQRFELIGNDPGFNRAIEKLCKLPLQIFLY